MANEPHLLSVKIKGKFTGDYKCSFCATVFRPHPSDQGVMAREFAIHVEEAHLNPKRKPREDFSQAAARIVREATDKA
jgi:hypothetical protein